MLPPPPPPLFVNPLSMFFAPAVGEALTRSLTQKKLFRILSPGHAKCYLFDRSDHDLKLKYQRRAEVT